MQPNQLIAGKPRIGWITHGSANAKALTAMLENNGDQIILTIPDTWLAGVGSVSDWLRPPGDYGHPDSPDKVLGRASVPAVIKFFDAFGWVLLVGCRLKKSISTMRAGQQTFVANYAVLANADLDLREINGLRSEMPALAPWTMETSIARDVKADARNRASEMTVTLRSPSQTRLARENNFRLEPSWRTSSPQVGTFAAHDLLRLVTSTRKKQAWGHLLHPHRVVQDLLSISAWRPFGFTRIEVGIVQKKSNAVGDDQVFDMEWSEAIAHGLRKHEEWKSEPKFLFSFADIGPKGVERWLRLRTHYERAMSPLIAVIDQRGVFGETGVLQTGIALEALGYQLAKETGTGLNGRGQVPYAQALRNVIDDMTVVPVADVDAWIERSNTVYRAVKHPDNAMPDHVSIAEAFRENALVLRCWVAGRLGCPEVSLRRNLQWDPLAAALS